MGSRHLLAGVFACVAVAAGPAATGLLWALQAPGDTQEHCGTPVTSRPLTGASSAEAEPGAKGSRPYGPLRTQPVPPVLAGPGSEEEEARRVPATTGSPGPTPPSSGPLPLPGLPPASAGGGDAATGRVEAIQATDEVPEERLIDVGVQVFGSGLEEGDRERLAEIGITEEVRRSEGRFIAYHLKKTLERTGNWGAVRVVPGPGEGLDLFVAGRILESNGKRIELEIEAVDATNRRWLSRRYEGEADRSAYRAERPEENEAFQDVYNRIANDLLAARDEIEAPELVEVRRVAALRFARALSSEAFGSYLRVRSGHYSVDRLPAEDDPMQRKVSSIRERDLMLVDTLNEHYQTFYEKMARPYASWRSYSHDEQDALDRIRRESRLKKILGGAAVLAGVMMEDDRRGRVTGVKDVALMGGLAAMQAGFRQSQEAGLHKDALQELALSFDGEMAPLLVEVEGHQLKLTGSAEAQFASWRELLRQVFALETGLPGDPNAVTVTPSSPN